MATVLEKRTEERFAFEQMLEKTFRDYFSNRVQELVTGKILIEDDGTMIRVYERGNKEKRKYDLGIVY